MAPTPRAIVCVFFFSWPEVGVFFLCPRNVQGVALLRRTRLDTMVLVVLLNAKLTIRVDCYDTVVNRLHVERVDFRGCTIIPSCDGKAGISFRVGSFLHIAPFNMLDSAAYVLIVLRDLCFL